MTLFDSHPYRGTCQPGRRGRQHRDEGGKGVSALTSPSKSPSPVVAQLGTTYQILSLSLLSCSFSVISVGDMARNTKVESTTSDDRSSRCSTTYRRRRLACWRTPAGASLAFLGRRRCAAAPVELRLFDSGLMNRRQRSDLEYLCDAGVGVSHRIGHDSYRPCPVVRARP